ncbi:cortactin binding protein N-terminal like nausicaa isoform X1 [Rhipicephalus microplus]|uniref:cortactin binding protein N-terminal like nausicaa isoform X1 n=1 Tax=Rhipicephalus microplus TaxID=6941 RepID=UPI003F6BE437
MAGRGAIKSQPGSAACSYEGFDKLTSSTLKRHPKMELNKTELLKLLSVLEGELQAREIVIAVLKAEQVKQLLYPRKAGTNGAASSDPWAALQRDVLNAFDKRFDVTSVRALHGLQLHHLEQLIALHRRVQARNREELRALEQRCAKLCRELEEERGKRAQDTAQGDNVTFLLEKEREHLRHEVDLERQQSHRLEKELQQANEALEMERTRQKQMVLLLLAERKRLIVRIIQERQRGDQLLQSLKDEKARSSEMVEGLEEESKRSLQMEEELERQAADFEMERERFQTQVAELKAQNAQQQAELERLRQEAERLVPPPAPAPLGEGVRSATIITPASAPAPTVRAAVPTPTPPRGVAVVPKVPPSATKTTPPTVPQVPPKPTPDRTLVKKPGMPTTPGTPGIASATGTVLRPTPPPVPPNKPVLQRKDLGPKPPVPPRTVPDSATQVGGGFTSSPARYTRCMMTSPTERVKPSAPAPVSGLDLIGPELADFQSLLVSMAMDKPNSPLRGGS